MKIDLRARHLVLPPEIRAEAMYRLDNALHRLDPWIRGVNVTIADTNGPKGGVDKECRLRVEGVSFRVVVAQAGVDVVATIAKAADRARQAVVRKMMRKRSLAY